MDYKAGSQFARENVSRLKRPLHRLKRISGLSAGEDVLHYISYEKSSARRIQSSPIVYLERPWMRVKQGDNKAVYVC